MPRLRVKGTLFNMKWSGRPTTTSLKDHECRNEQNGLTFGETMVIYYYFIFWMIFGRDGVVKKVYPNTPSPRSDLTGKMILYEFAWCESYKNIRRLEKSKHENPPLSINGCISRSYKNIRMRSYELATNSSKYENEIVLNTLACLPLVSETDSPAPKSDHWLSQCYCVRLEW